MFGAGLAVFLMGVVLLDLPLLAAMYRRFPTTVQSGEAGRKWMDKQRNEIAPRLSGLWHRLWPLCVLLVAVGVALMAVGRRG